MKSTLFLCGAGNAEGVRLAIRINEKNQYWEKIYILDDDINKKGKEILGIEIVGSFDSLINADPKTMEVANLVARTTTKRMEAYKRISKYGIPFVSLIDPGVDTWGVDYRGDIILYPNVIFSAGAVIDQGSIAFTGAVIGHGCKVGKFCIIAPGAVLNARIIMDDGVYIGTNSSILPDLRIGAWATVGLNSGVVQDIPAGATAIGVPAEVIMTSKLQNENDFKNNSNGVLRNDEHLNPCDKSKDDLESTVLKIWKQLLNVDTVNMNDNFFELGGHSLLAVQLYKKLKEDVDESITLIDVFHYPTVHSFINFILRKYTLETEVSLSTDSKRVSIFRQRFTKSNLADSNNFIDDNFYEKDK